MLNTLKHSFFVQLYTQSKSQPACVANPNIQESSENCENELQIQYICLLAATAQLESYQW